VFRGAIRGARVSNDAAVLAHITDFFDQGFWHGSIIMRWVSSPQKSQAKVFFVTSLPSDVDLETWRKHLEHKYQCIQISVEPNE
jgi:hypothetical protein